MPQLSPRCIPCPDISPECSNCPSGQTCFFVPNSCTACASASCGTVGSFTAPTMYTVPGYTTSPTPYSNTNMQTIPTASGILPVPTLRSYTIWSGTGLGPYSHTGTGPWSSMTGSEMSGMPMSWSSSCSTMTPSTTGGGGPIATVSLSSTGSGAPTATASVVVSPLTASVLSSAVPAATVLTPTTTTTSIATAGAGVVGVENSLGALVLLLIAMFVR